MLEILQDSNDFTRVWVFFSPRISTSEKGFGIADCLLLQFLSVTLKERCVCVCICVCERERERGMGGIGNTWGNADTSLVGNGVISLGWLETSSSSRMHNNIAAIVMHTSPKETQMSIPRRPWKMEEEEEEEEDENVNLLLLLLLLRGLLIAGIFKSIIICCCGLLLPFCMNHNNFFVWLGGVVDDGVLELVTTIWSGTHEISFLQIISFLTCILDVRCCILAQFLDDDSLSRFLFSNSQPFLASLCTRHVVVLLLLRQ